MITILYILIALQVLNIVGSIAMIGEPRKPRTKNETIIVCLLSGLMICFYAWVIGRLAQ